MNKFLSKLTIVSLLYTFTFFVGISYVKAETFNDDTQTTSEVVETQVINTDEIGDKDEQLNILKEKLEQMKKYYFSLKKQFLAGDISREEALSLWNNAITTLRKEKKNIFDKKMEVVKEKFSKIKERNPELAKKIQNKYQEVQSRRSEISLKMKEISDRVESGEITRKEAVRMRTDYILEYISKNKELKNDDGHEMIQERKEMKGNERVKDDDYENDDGHEMIQERKGDDDYDNKKHENDDKNHKEDHEENED